MNNLFNDYNIKYIQNPKFLVLTAPGIFFNN